MYNKVLTGILVVLLIAIIGALSYLGFNYYKQYKGDKDAGEYLEKEFDNIVVPINEQEEEEEPQPEENQENTNTGEGVSADSNANQSATHTGYYKGFKVIGKLEMPTISKQFPILDESPNANAIEVSILKIYGPTLNTVGNVVIAGHNYNNGTFFSRNKNLQIGDKLYVTDMTGKRVEYTIYNKYYTPESDNSYINRTTDGKVEITLYTCDATGDNRLIICARAE
ncbi:MAG: sortase [Clostridia bacterium]|nr:sortase [Clostridia bacterium]